MVNLFVAVICERFEGNVQDREDAEEAERRAALGEDAESDMSDDEDIPLSVVDFDLFREAWKQIWQLTYDRRHDVIVTCFTASMAAGQQGSRAAGQQSSGAAEQQGQ